MPQQPQEQLTPEQALNNIAYACDNGYTGKKRDHIMLDMSIKVLREALGLDKQDKKDVPVSKK